MNSTISISPAAVDWGSISFRMKATSYHARYFGGFWSIAFPNNRLV
jgi:hypothetical protein